jgi:alpha-tubulin suppressor-like RCC1 family protein
MALVSTACGRIGFDKQSVGAVDAGVPGSDADAQDSSSIIIASGWTHTCAAIEGRVACWGEGSSGQLGQGDMLSSAEPQTVSLPGPATALAAGRDHSCAIVGGDAYCWGDGTNGRLGHGGTDDRLVPTQVQSLPSGQVTNIALARYSSCAVAAGQGYCWGSNGNGQLGIDTMQSSSTLPVLVSNLGSGISAMTSAADRACALIDTTAYCWGHDHGGDLGTPGSGGWQVEQVVVASNISQHSLALNTSCALSNGAVSCWGRGSEGELGNGQFSNSATAVDVIGLQQDVTTLHVAGGISPNGEIDATCAIQADELFCWGNNEFGQLGDQTTNNSATPLKVTGLQSAVRAVNGGMGHFCAATYPDKIECWGNGINGQLGNGAFTDSPTPVLVPAW